MELATLQAPLFPIDRPNRPAQSTGLLDRPTRPAMLQSRFDGRHGTSEHNALNPADTLPRKILLLVDVRVKRRRRLASLCRLAFAVS